MQCAHAHTHLAEDLDCIVGVEDDDLATCVSVRGWPKVAVVGASVQGRWAVMRKACEGCTVGAIVTMRFAPAIAASKGDYCCLKGGLLLPQRGISAASKGDYCCLKDGLLPPQRGIAAAGSCCSCCHRIHIRSNDMERGRLQKYGSLVDTQPQV
eukprot:353210-Chlamydomonas_euryale.AAC.2